MRCVGEVATPAQDAATFALRCTTPYSVFDAVHERVFETLEPHRASHAHTLRRLDTGAVGRKELARIDATTPRLEHPRVFVGGLLHGHLHFNEPYGVLVPMVHIEHAIFTRFEVNKTLLRALLLFLQPTLSYEGKPFGARACWPRAIVLFVCGARVGSLHRDIPSRYVSEAGRMHGSRSSGW